MKQELDAAFESVLDTIATKFEEQDAILQALASDISAISTLLRSISARIAALELKNNAPNK